jgi:hypothetical protein
MHKEKHSDTCSANFFIGKFFFFSALGAAVAPKALADAGLSARGGVCSGRATAMVTIAVEPAAGSCLGAASAEPINRSTMMEGTFSFVAISSPTTSSTLCLLCLGFGEQS